MLDDLKFIAQRDKSDAFGVVAKQYKQLLYDDFSFDGVGKKRPDNVVLAGMGGSALAGAICQRWWLHWLSIPLQVSRDYTVPAYVGENTLFIASSYSGNTEETIASLHHAETKGARIVIVTSGGKLEEIAKSRNYPLILIPGNIQPRMAVFCSVRILSSLFDYLGLMHDTTQELIHLADWLGEEAQRIEPNIGTSNNWAKRIAQHLVGKTAVVYSGPMLGPAAYTWKISLNESSKNLAWSNEFSEFNHNEFMGWTSHPVDKVFGVIELESSIDHPKIKKRMEVSNRLLSGKMPSPMIIDVVGDSHIKQLLWAIQLGGFVSLYLAMLNNVDPTPVDLVEKLKNEL